MTVAANGVTQIREFNGVSFDVIKELGACAYPNFQDSLTVVGGFTIWLGYDGNIYYHGSELPGEPEALYMVGTCGGTGIQNTLAGAILYGSSNGYATGGTEKTHPEAMLINYVQGGTPKVARFFPYSNNSITGGATTTTIYPVATPIYYPVKYLPRMSNLAHATIYMARETGLSTGIDDAVISFYKNGDTTAFMTKTVTTDDIMKGYKGIEINTQYVDSLQISVTYSNAVAITNKRFNPAYMVIEYTPTETIK
jgi:hypothetical protein